MKSKRQSGCPMCKPYKHRDLPMKDRKSWSELRKIGKRRKVTRHDLGDE